MTKEDKVQIIMEELEKELTIASFVEDRVKRAIRIALRLIEEREANEPPG